MNRIALPAHILETLRDIIKAAGPHGPGGRRFTQDEIAKIGLDLLRCGDDVVRLVPTPTPRNAG